jgi:flagellar protein FlaG
MSISTVPMAASTSLQHSPQIAQLVAGRQSAQGAQDVIPSAPTVEPVAATKDGEVAKPSVKQVQQSLDDINKVLAGFSISVQFKVDPDYKELIVKVVDQETGKLIRQIPTEDVVKMSKAMDSLKGLLFAQSV